MSLPAAIPPPARSWKDIRQAVSSRAMSREGRRRMRMGSVRFAALCFAIGACAWAAFAIYRTWQDDPAQLKEPVKTAPLRQVVFTTDGVLSRAWLDQTLALPKTASLMTLDLASLEKQLLASGQVLRVMLQRQFAANELIVTLQERTPIVRVMVQIGSEQPAPWLVARDGVVYAGSGYEAADLARLPWLAGIQLRRTAGQGFEPIKGMEQVAGLLRAANGLVPRLSASWQVVSLARLDSDQEIIVQSQDIPEIIFDAQGGFPRQLARLDYIVDSLHEQGAPPIKHVNLALSGQVPVELQATPTLTPAAAPRPARTRTIFQPKLRRDF